MATSLAAMTARRAATLARLSPSATRAASLVPRRGLAGASGTEQQAPPKANICDDDAPPKDGPSLTKSMNMFAYVGVSLFLGFITGMNTGAEKVKGEKAAEPAK